MKNITLTIPENCELIKEGNSYIIREQTLGPKTWKEFCQNYPITGEECFIDDESVLRHKNPKSVDMPRHHTDQNLYISWKEAEAFIGLMQLRQLRKAWVKNWIPGKYDCSYTIAYDRTNEKFSVFTTVVTTGILSFPTEEMAWDFFNCFKPLCEEAQILL